ncbi:MAG: hypothetical protein JOZ07_13950 [Solirubrobacterales bacterium]|nr:hypothetical protein [Solirubrobacterales bacterium]
MGGDLDSKKVESSSAIIRKGIPVREDRRPRADARRVGEITARERLLLPIEEVVQDLNRYLRGWAGYFRYGNSARHFNLIEHHAHNRLALFVAKRHQRSRAYGWRIVTYALPNRLGLIRLAGTIVAPTPTGPGEGDSRMAAVKNVGEPCAGGPHARIEVAAGGNRRSVGNAVRAPGAARRPSINDRGLRGDLEAAGGAVRADGDGDGFEQAGADEAGGWGVEVQ